MAEFLGSDEYNALHSGNSLPQRLTNDQTQFGEFELLLKRWIRHVAPDQIVVDVGARGRARSNSFDLLNTFGWHGILIEANDALLDQIQREFDGLDLELVHCAVSDYEGDATFFIGINDDVSSLSLEASSGWGPVAGSVTVPVRRLGPLLRERNVPKVFGLLSIDIEGEDIRVLNDVIETDGYRPRWVIIEASYDFATKSLDDLPFCEAVKKEYAIVAQTQANLILEHRMSEVAE